MRGAALVASLTVLVLATGAPGGEASQRSSAGFYVVRPDPRACPSPLCGGYWVALANHARTRCHDGLLRPRCYVATVAGRTSSLQVPDGALARATIGTTVHPDFGRLGALVVREVFAPVGSARPTGRFFRLLDTGVRCVRTPCFSIRASRLNRASRTTISGLVLTTLGYDSALEQRVLAALASRAGVLSRGAIVRTPNGGREFHASRFFLRAR